ncbi:uncharacterized protein EV420DRAFT_1643782 [Desarmillaria tabescens]|uniref:Mid2 domain-containing protein n=1 Tax=Armillaria tabescens TaxID=1929756 RepID=A0AA39KCH8_ARMTA|nr:uncharacterized protein EV420DRAFT_1643782 [Desarmillaria tabescens]KAK0457440.1 hypothetical protein EV420DRAFT_1643782 [Desarmillaria tabescens]
MNTTTAPLKVLFGLSFLVPYLLAQDHTQCVDSGSDWYTSVTGETPCRTYERLRKICNSNYVLGALGPKTPPDTCDDQVADCCCNSIAFGLSMLCLTCQRGIGSSGNGIDAGAFTNDIQTAVCNNELKIHDNFYDRVFWSDGSWFYTWSREFMEKTNAADANNSFTHCASTTLNGTSSSQSQSTSISKTTTLSLSTLLSQSSTDSAAASATPASTSIQKERSSKSLSAGAIAGIVVGSIAGAGAITLSLLWLCWYRRRYAVIEDSETSPHPFPVGHTPSVPDNTSTTLLPYRSPPSTRSLVPGERRFGEKRQRELPPDYTE